jgi:hypothetical protein
MIDPRVIELMELAAAVHYSLTLLGEANAIVWQSEGVG